MRRPAVGRDGLGSTCVYDVRFKLLRPLADPLDHDRHSRVGGGASGRVIHRAQNDGQLKPNAGRLFVRRRVRHFLGSSAQVPRLSRAIIRPASDHLLDARREDSQAQLSGAIALGSVRQAKSLFNIRAAEPASFSGFNFSGVQITPKRLQVELLAIIFGQPISALALVVPWASYNNTGDWADFTCSFRHGFSPKVIRQRVAFVPDMPVAPTPGRNRKRSFAAASQKSYCLDTLRNPFDEYVGHVSRCIAHRRRFRVYGVGLGRSLLSRRLGNCRSHLLGFEHAAG